MGNTDLFSLLPYLYTQGCKPMTCTHVLGPTSYLNIKIFNIKPRTFCKKYGFSSSLRKSDLATLGPALPPLESHLPRTRFPQSTTQVHHLTFPSLRFHDFLGGTLQGTEWWLLLSEGCEFSKLPQSRPFLYCLMPRGRGG